MKTLSLQAVVGTLTMAKKIPRPAPIIKARKVICSKSMSVRLYKHGRQVQVAIARTRTCEYRFDQDPFASSAEDHSNTCLRQ